jgi:hypothetical protein
MAKLFGEPDMGEAQRVVDQERKRTQGFDWSERYWRPKDGPNGNIIRLLPQRAGSRFSYHLYAAVHFVKHDEDGKIERFVCNRETYGKKCPACEEMFRLLQERKPEEAAKYRPRRFGVFNIIDREHPEEGIKLYEAPAQAVYQRIMNIYATRGRMSNLFDKEDEHGNVVAPGRDIMIILDKKAPPQSMYSVMPMDPSPLGTPEEKALWSTQVVDLDVTALYPEVDYDVAAIKTFGTPEEREFLRDEMRKVHEEEDAKQEEVVVEPSNPSEEPVSEQADNQGPTTVVASPSMDELMARLEAQQKEIEEFRKRAEQAQLNAKPGVEVTKSAVSTTKSSSPSVPKSTPSVSKTTTPVKTSPTPVKTPPTSPVKAQVSSPVTTSPNPSQEKLEEIRKKIEAAKNRLRKK